MSEKLGSRSEKRLRRRAVRSAIVRKDLLDRAEQGERVLSLESGEGKLVIAVSRVRSSHDLYNSEGKDPKYFREEAERLEAERSGDHQEVILRGRAASAQMRKDFSDPEVTDIILVGNGTINALPLDGGRYFDWWDAAKAATTLKRGRVEQRMCGNFPSEIPYHVPLGTFAVSDLRNVTAATGKLIPDRDPSDELFQPVYTSPDDSFGQIQALNELHAGKPPVFVGDNRQLASI